jgi:hypothetical protein
VENCGLKNAETAGPMIAADMITAPVGPTALRRRTPPLSTAALTGTPLGTVSMDTHLILPLVGEIRCQTSDPRGAWTRTRIGVKGRVGAATPAVASGRPGRRSTRWLLVE